MKRTLKMAALVFLMSAPVMAKMPSAIHDPGDEKVNNSSSPNVSRTKAMGVAIYRAANTSKMNLLIENYIEVPLQVTLTNDKGEVLHEERVGKKLKKYWRKFDMESMNDGLYTFEISDGYTKITKSFRLETPKVEVKQPARFVSLLN